MHPLIGTICIYLQEKLVQKYQRWDHTGSIQNQPSESIRKKKHWRLRGYEKIIREQHQNCLFHKRNILRQNKREGEYFYKKIVKKVMIKAGIPPSINEETVCRVLWKTDLKWSRFQRNRLLAKNDVKLRLDFARKVCHEHVMCNNEIWNRWY